MDPISSPICEKANIAVYDLEWWPDHEETRKKGETPLNPRLFGFYDGARYVSFDKIEHFMNHVLSKQYRGWWIFAHFGGLYDFNFFLRFFMQNPQYMLEVRFSGSCAVHVTVTRGKDNWYFCDSGFLLRRSLEDVGKWLGLQKGGQTKEERMNILTGPVEQLIPYNEQDCIILYKAIRMLESVLVDLGGELRPTLASCAMRLFRRKYLSETIRTSTPINRAVLPAYKASRVEPFERYAGKGVRKYDVNSSFPYSMTEGPCPGNFSDITKRIPSSYEPALIIVEAEVKIPETYLPPVPYRTPDGRIFFPTGTFRDWMSGEDVALLERTGCRIEKVYKCLHFDPNFDLVAYAQDLYARKNKADAEGNTFWREVYKLLLNALYGKFQERNEKDGLIVHAASTTCPHSGKHANDECIKITAVPGVLHVTDTVEIAHQHTPFAIAITARSRRVLYDGLAAGLRNGGRIFYCDTDSVITTNDLGDSRELGGFKYEGEIEESAEFLAPKLYRIDNKVKAKGFSGLTRDGFERLKEGGSHSVQRFARAKELINKGWIDPVESTISKRIYLGSDFAGMTKRFQFDDGSSRPWTVEEILNWKKKPEAPSLFDNLDTEDELEEHSS